MNVLCNGASTGSITINPTAGGVGPYQYSLNAGPFGGSNVFSGLPAGTYTVTIRDANLCTVTISNIIVTQPAPITGTPAVVNAACGANTGSITINGTAGGVGPYQYSLNAGPFQGSNVFSALGAGTYSVTIRDANLCTVTITNIIVASPGAPTGTPAVVNVTCNGGNNGSITINAVVGGVGPYQFSLNGGPNQGSNVFSGLIAGTYTVTITDALLCSTTINGIVVTQPAAITGTPAVVNVLCNGGNTGSITINGTSGGNGVYQYSLNGGPIQGSNVFGGLIAGTYSVVITDGNGCTGTLSNIIVAQPATITGTPVVVNVLCNGGSTGSITINPTAGGVGPYQYSLGAGPFGASNVFNGLTAGTYSIRVRDANLCILTLNNIIVTEPAVITGTPAVVNAACGANTGSITINGTAGGVGPYQYSLNAGPFQGSNVFSGLGAGTYTVTIRDANLCTVTITNIVVASPGAPTGTPAVVNLTCNGGNNGSITINGVGGGVGPYQFSLNGGPNQGSNVFSGLTAGTYTVTITDALLCATTINGIVVTEPVAITGVPAVVDVLCNGGNTGSITINATSGGNGVYQYSLNGGPQQGSNVFGGLIAGTYSVVITDGIGCTGTLSNIIVAQPAAITATPAIQAVLCNGGNTGSITINATAGGNGVYQYSLNGGPSQGSNVFGGLIAGTYTVTITDGNGCSLTLNNLVVTEPAVLAGVPAVVNVLCNGGITGSITINGTSGGNGVYQYSLNGGPAQGSNVFGGLIAGIYTVTISDGNGCSLTLNNLVVTEPSALAGVPAVVDVLCNGGNTGSITINGTSGGNGGYQYSLNGGPAQGSNVFGGLVAGTYSVTISDANGCTLLLSNIVVGEPAAITGTAAIVDVLCNGNSTGSITINGTAGGNGVYQYSLNGGPQQGSNVFAGLVAGTFNVVITDGLGCTFAINNIVVAEPNPLAGTPLVTDVTCNGANDGIIALNGASGGVGPYQYSLNAGPLQLGNTFGGLSAGSYNLLLQDANGCTLAFNNLLVAEPQALSAADSTVMGTCVPGNDGQIWIVNTAGGTGAYLYSLDGAPGQVGNSFTGVSGGAHTVVLSDANGCTFTLNVVVPVPGGISATDSLAQVTCNGAADGGIWITASGGSPGYQYSLNGGALQAGNSFLPLAPGIYVVNVQDQLGCVFSLNATITEPTSLVAVDSTVGASCNPGSDGEIWILNAAGGTPGYQYSLNGAPLQADSTFTGLNGGSFVVTVVDLNGCQLTLNPVVASPGNVAATDSSLSPGCTGALTGTIWVNGTSTALPVQYSLNGGAFQPLGIFTGLGAGIYTVDVRDALGCTITLSVTLTDPSPITATDSTIAATCFGAADGEIYIVGVSGGTPGYQFSLNGGPLQSNNNFQGYVANTYTALVQDANGCQFTFPVILGEPASLVVADTMVQPTCGNANGSITLTPTGGTAPYTYLWSNSQTTATATNLIAGTYTYTVTDAHGCQRLGTVVISNLGAPTAGITQGGNVSCFGGNDGFAAVTVTGGTGPFQYAWNTPLPVNNDTLSGVGAGIWTVTVTDALGCTAVDSITIAEPTQLSAVLDTIDPGCAGANDGLALVTAGGGTPGYQFAWSTGDSSDTLRGLGAGAYTVTVTDANGCTNILSGSLSDPLPVIAAFNPSPAMPAQLQIPNASTTFLNMSQNASIYAWDFGDGEVSSATDPSHTYITVGDFCVTLVARDVAGCADTVEICNYSVFQQELEIPNTFTPNNDGRNDFFQILGIEQFPNNHLSVFNRWGNLVYEKDKYDNTWNGDNYKSGDPLPDGAYFFFFTTGNPGQEDVAGDVVIFR